MINRVLCNYIDIQFRQFLSSKRCCKKFCGSFRVSEVAYIQHNAKKWGLLYRIFTCNGVESIILLKNNCFHFYALTILDIKPDTRKSLFLFLKESNFVGSDRELQMSPNCFNTENSKPMVQPHRFSLGPLKQSMARENLEGQDIFEKTCSLRAHKKHILKRIRNCRVVIIDCDAVMEKSMAVPMFLIEDSARSCSHCKIICVEQDQLLAIYNSEKLAQCLGEKVGDTVAYQVHLQSRISETSNLIFTTASFLLRVLMGQNVLESFHHISHVIINDIHLHNAFSDILLCELKQGLRFYSNLKVILLSHSKHNDEFLSYFGQGEELRISCTSKMPEVIFLEDIEYMIMKDRSSYPPSYVYVDSTDAQEFILPLADNVLCDYNATGHHKLLEKFMYLVHSEFVPLNYEHSLHKYTVFTIASKYGHTDHIYRLLRSNTDQGIAYTEINQTNVHDSMGPSTPNCNEIDYSLIMDIIRMLTAKNTWKTGHILVLLPEYEHLIRMDYYILKHKLIGNLPQETSVHLLHCDIDKDELKSLLKPIGIQIVLATDIAQRIGFLPSFLYVIDSARSQNIVYDVEAKCEKVQLEWISRENLERRSFLAGRNQDERGFCFRLIPAEFFTKIPERHRPQLCIMPLDKICLTIKLLSQHKIIAEYFQDVIVQPPYMHIHHTVDNLKQIGVFDTLEDITWLGCRLIDIPLECHLGKLLIFAILLQCLDPVLTIVSFLTCTDPLELPSSICGVSKSFAHIIRHKIKQESNRLAEGTFSDHFIYIRLYQEWQNKLRGHTPETPLMDEHNFILNGILEKVCRIRTLLVGALRSSQLIHNQGYLSMHFVNLKSNSWPVIKAVLIGGFYPRICIADSSNCSIKAARNHKLTAHPGSVLRKLDKESIILNAGDYSLQWIVYGKESSSISCNNISHCTIVTPVAIALFAGPAKIHPQNMDKNISANSEESSIGSDTNVNFIIDDWIWFVMQLSNANLILKARQHFFSLYLDYLQYCGRTDKWRRSSATSGLVNQPFLNMIENILLREEILYGFAQPQNIGLRPKAVPNKFNAASPFGRKGLNMDSCKKSSLNEIKNCEYKSQGKQFFMLYLYLPNEDQLIKYCKNSYQDIVTNTLEYDKTAEKLTFFITYQKDPDIFSGIFLVNFSYGVMNVQNCFKNKIPISELRDICSRNNIYTPCFYETQRPFRLADEVGNIILDLFANRNACSHGIIKSRLITGTLCLSDTKSEFMGIILRFCDTLPLSLNMKYNPMNFKQAFCVKLHWLSPLRCHPLQKSLILDAPQTTQMSKNKS